MFYGLATNEDYFKEKINCFIALAPAVKLTKCTTDAIQILSKNEEILVKTAALLGIKEIGGKGWEVQLKRFENIMPELGFFKPNDIVQG